MKCLRCGWCCENKSPINGGKCPHLSYDGTIAICEIYETRPSDCYSFYFPSAICPIGRERQVNTTAISAHANTIHTPLSSFFNQKEDNDY